MSIDLVYLRIALLVTTPALVTELTKWVRCLWGLWYEQNRLGVRRTLCFRKDRTEDASVFLVGCRPGVAEAKVYHFTVVSCVVRKREWLRILARVGLKEP